jgi:hypothetical protein
VSRCDVVLCREFCPCHSAIASYVAKQLRFPGFIEGILREFEALNRVRALLCALLQAGRICGTRHHRTAILAQHKTPSHHDVGAVQVPLNSVVDSAVLREEHGGVRSDQRVGDSDGVERNVGAANIEQPGHLPRAAHRCP